MFSDILPIALIALVVACGVLLVIIVFLLLCRLLFRFLGSTTDSRASKSLRGRKIFIDQSDDYDMVVDYLKYYFAQLLGAIITDDSSNAEFQLILNPEADPMIIVCTLSDQHGNTKSLEGYEDYWPKPLAMAFANFIKKSDQRSGQK